MTYYNAEGQARMRIDAANDYYDSFATVHEPEPRMVTAWAVVSGLVCRVCDEQWPGHAVPALTPTRYDAVETISDRDVANQQREGGSMPAPRKMTQEVV